MKASVRKQGVSVALVLAAIVALVVPAAATSGEIPWGGSTNLPDYIGAPAEPQPMENSGVPQNPLLAPNPFNSAHHDTWNSDVSDIAAPLGRDPVSVSSTLADARQDPDSSVFACESIVFDSRGRVITNCVSPTEAAVVLADPDTLQVLDSYPLVLPPTPSPYVGTGRQKLLGSMGCIYSYLDAQDRFTVISGGNQILTLVEGGSEDSPVLELPESNRYDLSQVADPPEDGNISGIQLDWQGRIWFDTTGVEETEFTEGAPARIYVLNPATAVYPYTNVKYVVLDEGEVIRNTYAVTKIGANRAAAYVLTSQKLYRIEAGPNDQPYVVWSEPYDTVPSNTPNEQYEKGVKNGQYELGSGTSPTILGEGKYVAITDNADPMKVVVYRTAAELEPHQSRIVCEVPVFEDQEGQALSNSLTGYGLSLIATNNYDYWFDWETAKLRSISLPGVERIDIDPHGRGCTKVWTNEEVATTACPRLSTQTGLIYTIAREMDTSKVNKKHPNGLDVYYWSALDFRTGEVVWQKMAGTGYQYDGFYYSGGDTGPNGALYYGAYGGLVMLRDTP